MGRQLTLVLSTMLVAIFFLASCQKAAVTSETATSKNLYVASGLCYSGTGITTFSTITSSRMVSKVN